MTREPSPATLYAARLARAYPSLSSYSAASLAHELHAIERAQHRHAERCCSGEDGGYTKWERPSKGAALLKVHDPEAEARAERRISLRLRAWQAEICNRQIDSIDGTDKPLPTFDLALVTLHYDPRGRVLLLQLPGEAEPA